MLSLRKNEIDEIILKKHKETIKKLRAGQRDSKITSEIRDVNCNIKNERMVTDYDFFSVVIYYNNSMLNVKYFRESNNLVPFLY